MFDIRDSAKGGYRRVEVLSGPCRRRRWSLEEKAQAVAESLAPDAVVSAVARRWQVLPQQLFAWRREARDGLLGLPGAAVTVSIPRRAPTPPAFVPLVADPGAAPLPTLAPGSSLPVIEVELSGAVVRVPARGVDPGMLTSVLRAVRASASEPAA